MNYMAMNLPKGIFSKIMQMTLDCLFERIV
jgi:hypothetical protein